MTIARLVESMDRIAPLAAAESWDNVGLLVGDPAATMSGILLTIDYTPDVAAEAVQTGSNVVVCYHPPIFEPMKRVTAAGAGSLVFEAVRRGLALYSPHTALDVAPGGTNDMLADAVGMVEQRDVLKRSPDSATLCKIVVFVPQNAYSQVADAVFSAGAGALGNYSRCGFRVAGTGSFQGNEHSNPAIGSAGRYEEVSELRFESIVPLDRVAQVVSAMRRAHPYEEPAFDLVPLLPVPQGRGLGRIGAVRGEATAEMLANLLKRELQIDRVLIAGVKDRLVRKVAVCAGACGGEMLSSAIAQNADLYVTGEMRHHDALRAIRAGVTVICTLHSNSERAVLNRLAGRLAADFPGLQIRQSRVDRDPFEIA
jgi:dinuclear metal center YbgI/SA1388 family protein